MIVTNARWKNKSGELKQGFYMDGFLVENFLPIPKFLEKKWDCVGIISGHGKVGVGKSTMAGQIAYFLAWLIAGGEINMHRDKENKIIVDNVKQPMKKVNFSLNNVVFSAEDLMKKAEELPKNSVIVYDEGRSGLDSASAMTSINKAMAEFFQRCRVYHHVIIIVLPNFFKLHEDYAVARSQFLIDTYADENFNRGHFSFYNELQKERLFFFGKKKIGITAKYQSAHRNFFGRFTGWVPWDEREYDAAKEEALAKVKHTSRLNRMTKMRNAALYLLKTKAEMEPKDIAEEVSHISGHKIDVGTTMNSISSANPEPKIR
ncbi:MAG: hypothetical protein ACP5D2_02135 [Candidatus Nanoarchaeia archaeon]